MSTCQKCIMPDSYPKVSIDEDGICTLCKIHEHSPRFAGTPLGKDKLLEKLTSKEADTYHCVVPVSGGKDSTYALLYVAKELGLKPLAVSADSGFVADSAMENIEKVCKELSVDLVIHKARFRRHIAKQALHIWKHKGKFFSPCPPCETNNRSVVINEAVKRGIHFVVWGATDFEDDPATFFDPDFLTFRQRFARQQDVSNMKLLKKIKHRLRGNGAYLALEILKSDISATSKIKALLHLLFYFYYMVRNNLDVRVPEGWRRYLPLVQTSFEGKNVETIYLFDYIPYNPSRQMEILKKEVGWESTYGKEAKLDCELHSIPTYQGLKKTGISGDGFTFSVLVRYGIMSREEAEEKEAILQESLREDCERTLAELGFSRVDLLS